MRARGVGRFRVRGAGAEVFPWLETSAGGAALAGASLAGALAWWAGLGPAAMLVRMALGAVAAGLVGASLGAQWAVAPPDGPGPAPAPDPRGLWDPWLDDQAEDPAPAPPPEPPPPPGREAGGVLAPERARVRPRVISPESGEAMPLEDEVWPLIKEGGRGAVRILGGPGSGKTTALRHLAALMPPLARAGVLDDPDAPALAEAAARGLVVHTSSTAEHPKHLATFRLAPWGDDELIEYLLAAHRPRCGSVMARLKATDGRGLLQGIPELWRVVLDRMAADESVAGIREALRLELDERIGAPWLRAVLQGECLAAGTGLAAPAGLAARVAGRCRDEELVRLLRHRPVRLLLAAGAILDRLEEGGECDFLATFLPRELVEEAAPLIAGSLHAKARLRNVLAARDGSQHAMAASLLLASREGWRPAPGRVHELSGAYLDRASWAGVDLSGTNLYRARLVEADLGLARLDRAQLHGARLRRASLRGASLVGAGATWADLGRADLSASVADRARFWSATLEGANLRKASLKEADLGCAKLTDACLAGADLAFANLRGAIVGGATFVGANLEGARLRGLRLVQADFTGARFGGADLSECHLEGMELPAADFEDADLRGALLTGSTMPDAKFLGADLRGAGLAEVDWPRACLRDADLRGASFHLGSSRSGLVGSPIACEGSRTGFYTDDDVDRDARPPEEIRKANLRGADLRGADVSGVDFYLVDLREARYDAEQARHFRGCRAILDAPA